MAAQVETSGIFEEVTRGVETEVDPATLAATLVAALEQALLAAYRLREMVGPAAEHRTQMARPAPGVPAVGLSRREVEVLRLLALGLSNRQIAQALYLSPRTVQRHVANAYLKIGAHNKAEATAYVLRHRLA